MSQKNLPSINDTMLIAGLIAGAYIVYKFSKLGSSVVQGVSDFVGPIWQDTKTVASDVGTVINPKSYFPPVDARKTNPVGVNVGSTAQTAPDPYYSSGTVYDTTTYDPMGNVVGP